MQIQAVGPLYSVLGTQYSVLGREGCQHSMEFRAGGGRDSSLQVAPAGQVLLVMVRGSLKLLGPELDRRAVIL